MKNPTRNLFCLMLCTSLALALGGTMTGCQSSGSAEDLVPSVGATFTGTYTSGGQGVANPIVTGNSGPTITMFRVIQNGNRVQLQDNNNAKYYGTVSLTASGTDSAPVGNFNITGSDAAGHKITMIGVFTRNSASQLVMDGTWLEEDTGRSADIRAFSTSSQALEPTPVPDDDEEEENGQNQNPPTP